MTTKAEIVQSAVGTVPIGYTGAVILGLSLPDWAALLAAVCSLCLLAQYVYQGGRWALRKWRAWRK